MEIKISPEQCVEILIANGYEIKEETIPLPGTPRSDNWKIQVLVPYRNGQLQGPHPYSMWDPSKYQLCEMEVEKILQIRIIEFLKL